MYSIITHIVCNYNKTVVINFFKHALQIMLTQFIVLIFRISLKIIFRMQFDS